MYTDTAVSGLHPEGGMRHVYLALSTLYTVCLTRMSYVAYKSPYPGTNCITEEHSSS